MELHGDLVVLRPLTEDDVPRVVELGSHPEVARWWRGLTHEHVLEKAAARTRAWPSSRSSRTVRSQG